MSIPMVHSVHGMSCASYCCFQLVVAAEGAEVLELAYNTIPWRRSSNAITARVYSAKPITDACCACVLPMIVHHVPKILRMGSSGWTQWVERFN